jgi:hypothetical protein
MNSIIKMFICYLMLCVLVISVETSYGMLIDSCNLNPGNVFVSRDYPCGIGFPELLPGSNFIVTSNAQQLLVFDVEHNVYRGYLKDPMISYNNAILQNDNGWDVYQVRSDKKFIKIPITSEGEIRNPEFILNWDEIIEPKYLAYPETNQVFLFTSKIYRYTTGINNFDIFPLPDGWTDRTELTRLFPLEGTNSVLLYCLNNKSGVKHIAYWDLDKCEGYLLSQFIEIISVVKMKGDGNKYLCLVGEISDTKDLYIFNFDKKTFNPLMEDVPYGPDNLILDDSGKFVYGIISNVGELSQLVVINLENKNYEFKSIGYDDKNYGIYLTNWFLIPGKNQILSNLISTKASTSISKPVLIDLETFKLEFLDKNLSGISNTSPIYIPELNRVVSNESEDSIFVLDVEKEKLETSISLTSEFNKLDSNQKDIVTLSQYGKYLYIAYPSLGKIETFDIGYFHNDSMLYPDRSAAVLGFGSDHFETQQYNFVSGSIYNVDIPDQLMFSFYQDIPGNRILAVNSFDQKFYIINDWDNVQKWDFPMPDMLIDYRLIMDSDIGQLWMPYNNEDKTQFGFVKLDLSDSTYENYTFPEMNTYPTAWGIYNHGEYIFYYSKKILYVLDPKTEKIVFNKAIYNPDSTGRAIAPAIVPVPDKKSIYVWDGSQNWHIDVENWQILNGETYQNPNHIQNGKLVGYYAVKADELIYYDTAQNNSIYRIDPDSGSIKEQIILDQELLVISNYTFDQESIAFHFFDTKTGEIKTLRIEDHWNNAPSIKPQGQFVEYRPGDTFKLILDIANPPDAPQDVTAYIWFWLPTGQYIFFGPNGLTTEVKGMPLTLPANLDTRVSIDLFTVPQSMPAGFYNLNAVFFNNRTAVRGPMGTYNFMAGE